MRKTKLQITKTPACAVARKRGSSKSATAAAAATNREGRVRDGAAAAISLTNSRHHSPAVREGHSAADDAHSPRRGLREPVAEIPASPGVGHQLRSVDDTVASPHQAAVIPETPALSGHQSSAGSTLPPVTEIPETPALSDHQSSAGSTLHPVTEIPETPALGGGQHLTADCTGSPLHPVDIDTSTIGTANPAVSVVKVCDPTAASDDPITPRRSRRHSNANTTEGSGRVSPTPPSPASRIAAATTPRARAPSASPRGKRRRTDAVAPAPPTTRSPSAPTHAAVASPATRSNCPPPPTDMPPDLDPDDDPALEDDASGDNGDVWGPSPNSAEMELDVVAAAALGGIHAALAATHGRSGGGAVAGAGSARAGGSGAAGTAGAGPTGADPMCPQGLPPSRWAPYLAAKGITAMYDWQREAWEAFYHMAGPARRLVYTAPTSGGKTLVADIAMLWTMFSEHRSCIFMLPLIAVVDERVADLRRLAHDIPFHVEKLAGAEGIIPPIRRKDGQVGPPPRRLPDYLSDNASASSTVTLFIIFSLCLAADNLCCHV